MDSSVRFRNCTSEEAWSKIVDYSSVGEMWEKCVSEYSNLTAIVDGANYTYADLEKEVSLLRAHLLEKGIKSGDRVGVYAPNSINFVISFLAITTIGAVAVLLPAHLDNLTVFGCTLKFNLKGLVYNGALSANVEFAKEKNPAVVYVDDSSRSEKGVSAVKMEGDAPCAILFTGGTTGKSKGALLSHKAIMRGTKNGCYGIYDVFNLRYFLVLPLTHVFGLVRNLLTSLYTGSSLYICRNTKNMFREIAEFKPTIMVLVPALAEMALNLSKQFKKNMLGEDMKTIICGAAAVPPYLIREYQSIGVQLLAGYGLTESANLVSGNPDSLKKPESVGVIYEGMEYKIVDGELWLKGINMMDGYVGEEGANEIAYEDGWFKTGDLVKMDEEGYLYIVGRKKEIIVLPSGENVSPAEVESKFYSIDEIQDCLCYLDENEGRGVLTLEVLPRLTVIKQKGITDVEKCLKDAINKVNLTLPSFERISKIKIRDTDFLRSPSMKIIRGKNPNE